MRVVYLQERYRLPRVRAMIDFLFQTFGRRPGRAVRTG
jgi:DNA-binding transcriptional LysR family regulator